MCFLCLITLNTHYSKYIDLHLTLELEGRGAFWRTVLFMVLARCSSLCLKETHGHHFVKKKKKKRNRGESSACQQGLRICQLRFAILLNAVWHVRRETCWQLFHLEEIYCAQTDEADGKKSLILWGRRNHSQTFIQKLSRHIQTMFMIQLLFIESWRGQRWTRRLPNQRPQFKTALQQSAEWMFAKYFAAKQQKS